MEKTSGYTNSRKNIHWRWKFSKWTLKLKTKTFLEFCGMIKQNAMHMLINAYKIWMFRTKKKANIRCTVTKRSFKNYPFLNCCAFLKRLFRKLCLYLICINLASGKWQMLLCRCTYCEYCICRTLTAWKFPIIIYST